MFLIKDVNDQTESNPALWLRLLSDIPRLESDVTLRNRVGIVENENGRFEANIVLVKVLPVLLLVPFKSHDSPRLGENTVLARACQYICMYSIVYASRAQKVETDITNSEARESAAFADMAERVGLDPSLVSGGGAGEPWYVSCYQYGFRI
jgi:hypothetical protein